MKNIIINTFFVFISAFGYCQTSLSAADEQSLLYMLEEEKLALDVYTQLNNIYNQNPFGNIINSEQSHITAVANILSNNGSTFSILPTGVFNNTTLQNLYNQLVAQGQISWVEALKVGMTIEDVDIFDLEELKNQTQNPTIIATYDWLICGSKNHMRSFKNKLIMNGGTYTPQFISVAEYNTIIAGTNATCTLNLSTIETNFNNTNIISNTLVKDNFFILLNGKSQLKMYNTEGKLVLIKIVNSKEIISISDFPNGIYILNIINNQQEKNLKILKQ